MAGATRYLNSAYFGAPFPFGTTNGTPRLDAIRSFTVGNLTSATYVDVYMGQGKNGVALFTVPPGSNVTMPIEQTQWVTFAFRTSSVFDGFCYLHIDSDPLAASGFQSPIGIPPVLAPQGYSPLLGGGVMQWGSIACTTDGSTISTPTFLYTFPVQVFQCFPSINTGLAPSGYQLKVEYFGLTRFQVSFQVSGGPPGYNVNVSYLVIGV